MFPVEDTDFLAASHVPQLDNVLLAQAFTDAYTAGGGRVAASAPHNEGGNDYRPEPGTLAATVRIMIVNTWPVQFP